MVFLSNLMSKIWIFFQPRDLETDTKSVHSYDEAYGGGNTPTPQVCVDFSHVIIFLHLIRNVKMVILFIYVFFFSHICSFRWVYTLDTMNETHLEE